MPNTTDLIVSKYEKITNSLEVEKKKVEKSSLTISLLRLVVFVLTIALITLTFNLGFWPVLVFVLGISVFLFLVKRLHSVERRLALVKNKILIVENEVQNLKDLKNVYYDGSIFSDDDHFFTSDLDVFGPFSLYAILNRCKTYDGLGHLSQLLSNQPSLTEVEERVEKTLALEDEAEWRLEFQGTLFDIKNGEQTDAKNIVSTLVDADISFAHKRWLSIYKTALLVFWPLAILSYWYFGGGITTIVMVVVALVNFKISSDYANDVTLFQTRLTAIREQFDPLLGALDLMIDKFASAEKFKIFDNGDILIVQRNALSRLNKIAHLLDFRLHAVPSFILNIGFLWDSRIIEQYDKWKNESSSKVLSLFDTIGMTESMCSLATWADNHPNFSYPMVDEEYFSLEGKEMVHPLIKESECVPNDFIIEKETFVNIITGSNMSGKSTFLRTLGLNIILAQAGTKVCASKFKTTIIQLISYMRIKDNLEENESTFKAELNKVSKILNYISRHQNAFILADEMLRGTNSKDKLKGSLAIVKKLVEEEAYSVVATHDIALAEYGESTDLIKNYFFDIDYADEELLFDYQIKPGVCTSFNASFLLKRLGLEL